MRTWQRVAGLGLLAAALPVLAADHREAPTISQLPGADLNDIYAFRDPVDPNTLILVMTVNPVSDPDFAGSYAFSPDVLYRFGISNTGDAAAEYKINIVFGRPTAPGVQTFRARFPGVGVVAGDVTPPSTPDAPVIVDDPSGISVFAGPRDDPFFFDAVGFNRFAATGEPGQFRGIDSFADFNVSAIVIAVPVDLVSGGSDQLEISGFTFVRRPGTFQPDGPALDRTGNPAVSTATIPFLQRNAFNRTRPQNDATRWADTIVASLTALGTSDENIGILASVAVPDTLKLDLGQPDEFPNGRLLDDDVIDTLFFFIFNGGEPTGDGVDANDVAFLEDFPFLAPPFQAAPAP